MNNYDDIINYEYHGSKRKNKMSIYDRAAQFASFEALVGHKDKKSEAARLVDSKIELTNDEKIAISNILNSLDKDITIDLTYFIKDRFKDGGKYLNLKTKIIKVDEYNRQLVLDNHQKINIDDIYNIEIIKDI